MGADRVTRINRADALNLFHGVMLDGVTSARPDLSARQMVILTSVYLRDGPHTVRSLAKTLGVTKAVVTRALDTLQSYDYLARGDDPRDGRSVIVKRTAPGHAYINQLGETISQTFRIVQLQASKGQAKPDARSAKAQTARVDALHSPVGAG